MINLKNKIVASAFCIATVFCFSQENKSGVCRLGELKNDSLLPFIKSVKLDCSTADLKKFKTRSSKLNSLTNIIINGDASAEGWEELFKEIKSKATINSVVFDKNTFSSLPYGFENLYNIEQLVISNNDEMDYDQTFQQLALLPNLRDISLDIYSTSDLPDSLFLLKNLTKIALINKEEEASENGIAGPFEPKKPVTYDFTLKKGDNNFVAIKYISSGGQMDSVEYEELANRFNGNRYYPESNEDLTAPEAIAANQSYTPIYNFVKPPIAGLDIERKNYSINSGIDNVLVSPSGTKIFIPADAFIDQAGNPVKGSVTLNYREFRDPVDFMVSGIPMKYKSEGGVVNNFESAGMFEIDASVKQQPLKLAPGKQIQMNFVSTSVDSTYNFYSFNDSIGNWVDKNKPQTVSNNTKITNSEFSDAYLYYKRLLQSRPTQLITTSLSDRFKSFDYIYTSLLDNNYKTKRYLYKEKGKDHYKRIISLIRLSRVRKTKDGDILFKLRYSHQTHPEMAEFNNVYFVSKENISACQFKKKYLYKQQFNDVRIYQKGEDVEIQLKGIKNYTVIDAGVVTLNDKSETKKVTFFKTKMKRYNKSLKNRERRFKNQLKRTLEQENFIVMTDPKELSLYAYNNCKKVLSKMEKKMSSDSCIAYFNHIIENEKQIASNAQASSSNLLYSLSLDGMGIFNCDQIQRLKQPVEVFASYKNKDSDKITPQKAYVIDKKINAVLQYDGLEGAGPNKIAFSNSVNAENVLLTVNEDGTMAIYKTEDFKQNSFSDKCKFSFKVQDMESKITTVADLKKTIGL